MSKELLISTRGIEMPASPIRKLAPLAYAAQDRGVKIYRLNIGQPDLPTPQKALDVLKHIDRTTPARSSCWRGRWRSITGGDGWEWLGIGHRQVELRGYGLRFQS